jgi:hypothetical protein
MDNDSSDHAPLLGSPTALNGRNALKGGSLKVDGDEYSYAYGPQGFAGLFHNPYVLGCAVFASIGGLTFGTYATSSCSAPEYAQYLTNSQLGYDQGVIANILVMKDFLQRWPVTPWQKGVMSTYGSLSLT